MAIVAHLLPAHWAEDDELLALLREVVTQWRSSHGSLLRLVEVVTTKEGPALLAEPDPPLTFASVLRAAHATPVGERAPWAVARVCELAAALASVAAPHGDLRPASVGFKLDGRATVAPPLGRVGIRSSTRTGAGVLKPNVFEWLSPEVAGGGPTVGRSDVYQLGHLTYRLLGGPRAFPQDTELGKLQAVLSGAPVPPLRSVGVAVSHELEQIVARAMAPAAEDRYGTVRELADALAPFDDDVAGTRTAIAASARAQPVAAPDAMVSSLLTGGPLRSPCPRRWADLTPTADPAVRDCSRCHLSVQRITSAAELIPLGGSCVFFDQGVSRG